MRVAGAAPLATGSSARDAIARRDRKAADKAVAARIAGKLVDLSTPVADGVEVEPVLPDSADGLEVIRHSTAHLMAQAVQDLFPGTQVTIGPVIEDGFYYDFVRPEPFTPEDLKAIEKKMKEIVSRNLVVTRHEMAKTDAISLFASMGESYKVEILERDRKSVV